MNDYRSRFSWRNFAISYCEIGSAISLLTIFFMLFCASGGVRFEIPWVPALTQFHLFVIFDAHFNHWPPMMKVPVVLLITATTAKIF